MESAFPPTYEEATTKNHWSLVANYISGPDLCACCLVCRNWHALFAPFLWGNPAGHFGTENDRVYVALTRFKRALPTASLQVRQLTHTVHLPPALSEIYNGPKAEWLRDVLERLPNLQSLLVSQLPFFDHSALLALRRYSRSHVVGEDEEEDFPRFNLRLLIASKCGNATSAGLAESLLHMPRLVFLDLSETSAAKDPGVLYSLRFMTDLQVLKLRGVGLRDDDVEILADSIKIQVRSLDLSNNRLTDESVRTLLAKCFHSLTDVHTQHADLRQRRRIEGDWPIGLPLPDDSILWQLRGNDLDERFLQRLTKPGAGRIISEDLPPPGVTHLYISNNFVSLEGLASLIRTENLHVLDAGALDTSKALNRPGGRGSLVLGHLMLPGAEKLTPLLDKHAKKNLTFLRINHAVVTQPAASHNDHEGPIELEGTGPQRELDGGNRTELDGSSNAIMEMPDAVPVYELSADSPTPRYELASDPMGAANANGQAAAITPYPEPDVSPVRSGPAFAPEVTPISPLSPHPFDLGTTTNGATGLTPQANERDGGTPSAGPEGGSSVRNRIYKLERRRNELRNDMSDATRGLLPGSLPALRTLVLTEVPNTDDSSGSIITALQKFITDCAEETELALAQASLEYPTVYVPGKPRDYHHEQRSRELFSLKRVVLELSPFSNPVGARLRSASESSSGSPVSPSTPVFRPRLSGFNQPERSSTGDPDTEAFWKAQENDFSFFGEEECGQPVRDPGRRLYRKAVEEKMALSPTTDDMDMLSPVRSLGSPITSAPQPSPSYEDEPRDIVAELAKWRREKKLQAERLAKAGGGGSVAGHWRGEIKVVRPDFKNQKGYINWYGNYYEKGLYR